MMLTLLLMAINLVVIVVIIEDWTSGDAESMTNLINAKINVVQ